MRTVAPNSQEVTSDEQRGFAEGELRALAELKDVFRKVAAWPPDSPLSFIGLLAPVSRGQVAERLLDLFAAEIDVSTGKASSVAYDRRVGKARIEAKFSTEVSPRFQQVRDPRLEHSEMNYDALFCVSARPEGLVYWLIPANDLGELIEAGHLPIQHARSDTRWFWPSRSGTDAFTPFRYDYAGLLDALRALV